MAGNARQVINMANSIVGVSILSMPFCFKQTGLLLGVILVLVTGFITKKTCMFLIRSAIMARRRSYEFLAFHVFGVSGKLFVEMCMILFLFGICISFYVVMGDLAPAIVARLMNIENSPSLRCTLLIGIGALVVLPLCLLRNLDNLATMSACSIMFYFFLIVVIFWHAFPNLWGGSWIQKAELWRPAGALQVLPILSLALACQSNVFEIYDSVPDPDVPKMRFVVNHAVNLCSALYISVGFLGYVAFVDVDFSGNIIMSFPNSELTEGIKMFFTVSLAISFPLMIFPCRTSIHSLLYRRSNPSSFDLVGNYMPEARFKAITIGILFSSLVIGILIPNIELVLGLLGSTMGMVIATILPSIFFIRVHTKASAERLFAQGVLLFGIMMIVMGTYLNLAHIRDVQKQGHVLVTETPVSKGNPEPQLPKINDNGEGIKKDVNVPESIDSATRKEPVAPEPPPEESNSIKKEKSEGKDQGKANDSKVEDISKGNEGNASSKREKKKESKVKYHGEEEEEKKKNKKKENGEEESKVQLKNEQGDTLHPDAIQKEEKENEEEGDKVQPEKDIEKKQAEILEKMEEQHQEQQQILEEQKKILKELKDQKLKQEEDAKRQEENKAVNNDINKIENSNNLPLEAHHLNPVPQGVDSLIGKPIKSASINQVLEGQVLPKVDSKDLSQGGAQVKAAEPLGYKNPPSLTNNNNIPPQNQQSGNQPLPPVEPRMMAVNSVNDPSTNSKLGVNLQPPIMYYGSVQNLPAGSNQLNNPPSAPLPAANQQYPAASIPGQPAFVPSVPEQPKLGQNIPNQPILAGNLPVQNSPIQAGYVAQAPVANAQIQQAAVFNVPIQQPAAVIIPIQSAPVGSMPAQQPPVVNGPAQQAPVVNGPAQQVPVVNGPAQQLPVVNGPAQQLPVVNGPAQQAPVVNGPVQQAPVANGPIQQAPALYVANQQSSLYVPAQQAAVGSVPVQSAPVANVLGQSVGSVPVQPIYVGNMPSQQAPALNIPLQPVPAASLPNPPVPQANSPVQEAPAMHNLNQPVPSANSPALSGRSVSNDRAPALPPHAAPIPSSQSKNSDTGKIDASPLHQTDIQPSKTDDKVKSDQRQKLRKDTISKNLEEKHPESPEFSKSKKSSDVLERKSSNIDSSKKKKPAEEKEKSIAVKDKKRQHDEERKKREAELTNPILDLPQADVMSEFKWKDVGDMAYDTRHLLWTGRSRRRKRNKGRDEEYYWDET